MRDEQGRVTVWWWRADSGCLVSGKGLCCLSTPSMHPSIVGSPCISCLASITFACVNSGFQESQVPVIPLRFRVGRMFPSDLEVDAVVEPKIERHSLFHQDWINEMAPARSTSWKKLRFCGYGSIKNRNLPCEPEDISSKCGLQLFTVPSHQTALFPQIFCVSPNRAGLVTWACRGRRSSRVMSSRVAHKVLSWCR